MQPDVLRLIQTAESLIKDGFKVLPYCTEDLILCQRLVDVGCQAVMPWAAPIGTGQGPLNPYAMKLLRDRLKVPLLVDAGLGLPSHACAVMEWGFDAVLFNTAMALADDPVVMAKSFAITVDAGRAAYLSGAMKPQESAQASTPLVGTPFGTTLNKNKRTKSMSLIRDLADQIVAAHRNADLSIPIPTFSLNTPPPLIDNETALDHYELAGALAAIEMGFIESDAKVLGKAWSRMTLQDGGFNPFKWPIRPEHFDLFP